MPQLFILDSLPPWAMVIILLAIFGSIVIAVILLRKYAKPFKNTEKPKTDKEVAQEEVARLTQELEDDEYEAAKERRERKDGKPTEEEAREEEISRVVRPVEDEKIVKEMEEYDKKDKEK